MQDEFIRQYKHFEGLIARCYPGSGVTMEFTIQDILDYCSSIAQSHWTLQKEKGSMKKTRSILDTIKNISNCFEIPDLNFYAVLNVR